MTGDISTGAKIRARALAGFAAFTAVLGTGTVPLRAATVTQDAPQVEIVIEGRGWGHGVGMSQEGAYAMALGGASVDDILQIFYPGTSFARRRGAVRVELLDTPASSVVVGFPSGGQIGEGDDPSPGFPVNVSAGGSARIAFDGRTFTVTPLAGASVAPRPAAAAPEAPPPLAPPATTTTVPSLLGIIPLPPPPTTAPAATTTVAPPPEAPWPTEPVSQRPLTAVPGEGGSVQVSPLGRTYRGTVDLTAAPGGLQLVNELDVEDYLRGMGEVLEASWPAAALQAQAIAARTYALQTMAAGRSLCSSQQCQVYLGQGAEYAAMNRAVSATAGRVLTFRGSLAEAVYSANTGGVTATPEEGFGRPEGAHPYLVATPHPTNDPRPWEVRLPLRDVARPFRYAGRPASVSVTRVGPSGRPLEVTLAGDAGPSSISGYSFMSELKLQSTLFTLRTAGPEDAVTAEQLATGAPSAPRARSKVFEAGISATADRRSRAAWTAVASLCLAAWAATAYAARPHGRRRTREGSKASAV